MRRKFIVVNTWTGYICFNGRRFWTAKGAARRIQRSGGFSSMMSLREMVR